MKIDYKIMLLKEGIPKRTLAEMEGAGDYPSVSDYLQVYEDSTKHIQSIRDLLGGLFVRFNISYPEDYDERGMRGSDVIILEDTEKGERAAYFKDGVGFVELDCRFWEVDPDE